MKLIFNKLIFFVLTLFLLQPTTVMADQNLSQALDQYIEQGKAGTASVSMAVLENNKITYLRQEGFINIEDNITTGPDSVYEWGSVSKLLVWTTVMQLVEQGKLDLEKDIRSYLPDNFLTKLSFNDPITMTHLMNHTAGFQDTVYPPETPDSDKIMSLEEAVKYYMPSQIYQPGTVCSYSNWGASLAAYIVQEVAQQDWETYVYDHIFRPLGMSQTAIKPNWSDNAWVQSQRQKNRSYMKFDVESENLGNAISFIQLSPAGSATGTFNDFIKFARALSDPSKKLFDKAATYSSFFTATANYSGTSIPRNYHGMWVATYGQGVIGHSGNTNGYSSAIFIDPQTKKTFVVMTNEAGETYYNFGAMNLVFGPYQVPQKEDRFESEDISGIYTSSRAKFTHGFSKFLQYSGLILPIKKTNQTNKYQLAIGQATLEQVGPHLFIMDNGNGLKQLHVSKENSNGRKILETYSMDQERQDGVSFFIKVISFILFVLGVILSLVRIIILLIQKIRGKVGTEFLPKILINLGIIVVGTAVVFLLFSDIVTDISIAQALCILIGLGGIVILGLWFWLQKGRHKIYWLTSFQVILALGCILYWEWYNYWTF